MAYLNKELLKKFIATIYIQLILLLAFSSVIIDLSNRRALVYMNLFQNDQALKHLKRTLILDKNNLFALVWSGDSFEDENNLTLAAAFYEQAIKSHPKDDTGYYFRGSLAMREHAYNQAFYYFSKAVELKGKHYETSKRFINILKKGAD